MTHYNTQMGSGETACNDIDVSKADSIDGEVEYTVALPFMKMGSASWGNPYCGKKISIWFQAGSGPLKSVQATVRDKCLSCVSQSLAPIDIKQANTFSGAITSMSLM
jgi:hypothetical protein